LINRLLEHRCQALEGLDSTRMAKAMRVSASVVGRLMTTSRSPPAASTKQPRAGNRARGLDLSIDSAPPRRPPPGGVASVFTCAPTSVAYGTRIRSAFTNVDRTLPTRGRCWSLRRPLRESLDRSAEGAALGPSSAVGGPGRAH